MGSTVNSAELKKRLVIIKGGEDVGREGMAEGKGVRWWWIGNLVFGVGMVMILP